MAFIAGGATSTIGMIVLSFLAETELVDPITIALLATLMGAVATVLALVGFIVGLALHPQVAPQFETRLLVGSVVLGALSALCIFVAGFLALAYYFIMPWLIWGIFRICERLGVLSFRRASQCGQCGYDLAGLLSSRCPECGALRGE